MTAPLPAPSKHRWAPTHQHRKGGLYRVLAEGILETDRSAVVIYDDADGTVWVRPAAEFDDGRFAPLEPAPVAQPPAPKGLSARLRRLFRADEGQN